MINQKDTGLTQRLGIFTIDLGSDVTSLPWGSESIFRNGEFSGYVTSAGFGYSLGKAVCMGYVCAAERNGPGVGRSREENTTDGRSAVVTRRYLKEGDYQIEIDGKLWPATLHLTPPL